MKTLIVIMSLLIATKGNAQDTTISFSKVFEVPNTDKTKIFDKTYLWAIDGFKNVSNAMQAKDKEAGLLAFTATLPEDFVLLDSLPIDINKPKVKDLKRVVLFYYSFKLRIQIKDNKYKLDFSDIKVHSSGEPEGFNLNSQPKTLSVFIPKNKIELAWNLVRERAAKSFNNVMEGLYQYIIKKDDF